jgi:hypothetical protein
MHYAKGKLTATRKYIVLAPSGAPYGTNNVDMSHVEFSGAAQSVHIVGYGATLNRSGGVDGHVLEVRNGAVVTIEGLTVSGARGVGGDGIVCASSLTLYRATIADNSKVGISGNNCTLTVSRSMIWDNRGGGIALSGTFMIVNNFVINNGSGLSAVAGLDLSSSGDSTNALEFNTIVANNAAGAASDGIDCNASTLVARNNIVVGGPSRLHITGPCMHSNTLVAPDGAPNGSGNMNVSIGALMFVSDTSNFHIQAGSAAAGMAQSSNLSPLATVDFDGDSRVQGGAAVDVGADEIQ